jgi:hypothetical protein
MTLNSSKVFSAVGVFIIIASLVSSPFAQPQVERLAPRREAARAPQRLEEKEKAAREQEKKALALLDEVVAGAMSFKRANIRVYVLAIATDLWWDRDEGRARALAREAMDQAVACLREAKEGAQKDERCLDPRGGAYPRFLISSLLADRDARLALEFLEETRPLLPEKKDDDYAARVNKEEERKLELNAASRIAPGDPQTALRIAEKYLDDKRDDQFIELWSALLGKDPKASEKLTERIISDLESHLNYRDESELVYRVLGILRSLAGENTAAPDAARLASAEAQQAYRDALKIVVAAALKVTPAQLEDSYQGPQARRLLAEVRKSLPDIERHLPARAPAAGAKLAQFAELLRRQQSPQKHRIENPRQRDADESIAAIFKEMEKSMKEGKPEEARRSLSRFKGSERVLAWIELAEKAEEDKDQKLRREALAEAGKVLGDRMGTESQVDKQLELAVASLDFDPDRSFKILGSAVDRLNTVLDAAITITKFERRSLTPDGVRVSAAGEYDEAMEETDFAGLTTPLDKHSLAFAQKDFDRAAAALKRLQIDVVRLGACMMLAYRILNAGPRDNAPRRSWFPFP